MKEEGATLVLCPDGQSSPSIRISWPKVEVPDQPAFQMILLVFIVFIENTQRIGLQGALSDHKTTGISISPKSWRGLSLYFVTRIAALWRGCRFDFEGSAFSCESLVVTDQGS
jgi:hypothetical protein